MIRALVLMAGLAAPAGAETARVISGEHADFTRLVVELPAADDWTVGRTAMGYGFVTQSAVQPDYDLSTVWQRIPRTRLQALRVDPDTGALVLSLACPCHVFPFEYQPGMIVLDIRDGAAPPGSAFEAALVLPVGDDDVVGATAGPPVEGYDWRKLTGPGQVAEALPDFAAAGEDLLPNLDPLRDALLRQISRGAADGIIDMELPGRSVPPDGADPGAIDQARLALGELPGLAVIDGRTDPDMRPEAGLTCLPDEALALGDWGDGRPPLDLLAEARSGLYQEFDKVDTDAVLRSVRLHLHLGFGAEALQYARLVPEPAPGELPALISMARLVDGEVDPTTPFARMLACDGAAALWAALAHDRLPAADPVNADAIVRSFQALPPHLRRHLGARLADLLRDRDPDAARMVRDAMERTPDIAPGAVALLDAKADLHADRADAARAHAEVAVTEGAANIESLVALVEAHFRSMEPLSPDVADGLRAVAGEVEGTALEPAVRRAETLALALSGQLTAAFALAGPDGAEAADLWQVLARRGEDDDLLRLAVLPVGAPVPAVAPKTGEAIAARLLDLGFPEAALAWLGPVAAADADARRRLAARAELARGDARQALTLATGLDGEDMALLRAEAQTRLGALAAAELALVAAGLDEEAARRAAWEGDWPGVAAAGADPWAKAAGLAVTRAATDAGPLARGEAALDASSATREALSALLSTVPPGSP